MIGKTTYPAAYNPPPSVSTADRQPLVHEYVERLDGYLNNLHDYISQLNSRLSVVSRPKDNPDKQVAPKPIHNVAVVDRLADMGGRAAELSSLLEDMVNRLEV